MNKIKVYLTMKIMSKYILGHCNYKIAVSQLKKWVYKKREN